MPLSLSALIDDGLLARLTAVAERSGRRLYLPHGALIGTDNLVEWRAMWDTVEITFVKNPAHIDFSASGIDPAGIEARTVVYDGPVRGIASLFPRNVNTMVTCALATIGLDRCGGRLIAQPGSATASIDVVARGRDGSELHLTKVQPMAGVSGTEMVASTLASLYRAVGADSTVAFV
jgi:predicted dinucleotide-utilizing enzyme